jgi:hypothetical protein
MTLAPPSRARWTKARRTPDLPIPAIPCRQITCVSPRRSSSRARSSASRPTKGTRRRWETAVAMTAVSPRAPPGARAGSVALDDRDRQPAAHRLHAEGELAVAISSQSRAPRTQSPARRTEQVSTPSCHARCSSSKRDRGRAEGTARELRHHRAAQRVALCHPVPAVELPDTFACRGMGACPRPKPQTPARHEEQAPCVTPPSLSQIVLGERLTPELGDVRLNGRKQERAAVRGMTAAAPTLHGKQQSLPPTAR